MKKWLIGLLIVLLLAIFSPLLLLPKNLAITSALIIPAPDKKVYRLLTEHNLLQQIMKEDGELASGGNQELLYRGSHFRFEPKMFEMVEVVISNQDRQMRSFINFIPLGKDSTGLEWKTQIEMSNNPLIRLTDYLQAKKTKKSMADILSSLQKLADKDEMIYGLRIQATTVSDTLLLTTNLKGTRAPATKEYYALINKLKDYIAESGAQETGYPMLNIMEIDTNRYETKVAIPINKIVPDKNPLFFKRMIPGNILIAEVHGGLKTVNNGLLQMEKYASDHGLVPPAISFQSLITNRLNEPDTTKWITKIYYPFY